MNLKEIKDLIEFIIEKDVAEFELERGDVKVRIRRGAPAAAPPAPNLAPVTGFAQQGAQAAATATHGALPTTSLRTPAEVAKEEEAGLHVIPSPIVGTFYDAPSPGAPPFVKLGDVVENGQTLCIIEAMKLMNEIENDVAGEIVKKFVNNGQPVEYGQPLFAIRPRS